MKKTLLILTSAVALLASASMNAQNKADEFNGYVFMDVRGGIGFTSGETSFGKLLSPAASIGVGYQITPVWALRADFSGWQGKGAIVSPETIYRFNYIQGTADALVDICNIFGPYRVKRAVNPYILAGIGANGRFNNSEAAAIKDKLSEGYYWEGSKVSFAGRAGVGVDFRLCNAVNLNIEVNTNFLSDKFNSKNGKLSNSPIDFQTNALIGLRINFGKGKKAKAAPAPVAPAPAPKEEPKPEPKVEEAPVVETVAPAPFEMGQEIYFVINKWDIRAAEAAKLDELAAARKVNPEAKVAVTGYADAATGTDARNTFLSQKRAEAVAAYLSGKGIASDRISVDYKGSKVQPNSTPETNRVAICIAK